MKNLKAFAVGQERFSDRLEFKTRLLSSQFDATQLRFWRRADVAELVPSLLFRIHCETRATVPLLEAALGQLMKQGASDPLAPGLIDYFRKLRSEEQGHDDWVLDSLEALGIPRDEIQARMPPATVAALVGMQYYWIYHFHPVALLGFIKIAEKVSTTTEPIDEVVRRTGLPRAAFAYHLRHVTIEPKHHVLHDEVLNTLPLSREQEALVGLNAVRTLHLLGQSIEEIMTLKEAGLNRGSLLLPRLQEAVHPSA